MPAQVKITVLKSMVLDDIVEKYSAGPVELCSRMKPGDVYITDGRTCPEGFCTWAFADIFKDILLVRQEAKGYAADKKSMVTACTDGFRPVIFLVEPYEEE